MKDSIFSEIKNNNTAYWLGFIAADGSVHKTSPILQIGLSSKDREHLVKFLNFIDGKQEISIHDRKVKCTTNNKYYNMSYIAVYNKQIKSDLLRFNIIPNKTYLSFNYLQLIPDEYKFAFICGYFDGDGFFINTDKTIGYGICGLNKDFLEAAKDYLFSMHNLKPVSVFYSKCYSFETLSKIKTLLFINDYLDLIDCDLLERKKLVAIDLKEKIIQHLNKPKARYKINSNKIHKTPFFYHKKCDYCGKIFKTTRKEQKYCNQECFHQAYYKCIHPSREELKEKIRKTSFTQIGREYGVSDNAVRKWCSKYNLPRTVKEIKSYSDEEWLKI